MGRETDLDHDGAEGGYGGDTHLVDEAALFASPLPMVGVERTTTRKELWVSYSRMSWKRSWMALTS